MDITAFAGLSDRELIDEATRAAGAERRSTAGLIALLAELDARRLYLGEGCSSLFTYCTQVLRLSEHAAYHRIEAARAARQFPAILELVDRGRPHADDGRVAAPARYGREPAGAAHGRAPQIQAPR